MKKIIGIVIASMVFANIGFAEMRLIEEAKVEDYTISTVCIDGYKFVVFDRTYRDRGSSMVQFYDQAVKHGNPQPVQC